MSTWSLEWGGLTVFGEHYGRSDGLIPIGARRRADGSPAWRLELRASDGEPWLMPRMTRPEIAGGTLVALTDCEHIKGSGGHQARLHCVSPEGALRWSVREQVEAWCLLSSGLLTVVHQGWPYIPSRGPLYTATLRRLRDGAELWCWTIPLSEDRRRALRQAGSHPVRARVEAAGGVGLLRITAYLRGGVVEDEIVLDGAFGSPGEGSLSRA